MYKPTHIGVSPLTGTIFAGNVLKDGHTWAANKEDVTGEACAAVAQHVLIRGGTIVVTACGIPKWEITVKEIKDGE